MTLDWFRPALIDLRHSRFTSVATGIDRVLTPGGRDTALEGIETMRARFGARAARP
jgi:copper homeostasis protein CutC